MSMVQKATGLKAIAAGQHTTVAASDSVTTGLRKVHYALGQADSNLADTDQWFSVAVSNQYSAPGEITIKTWMPTGAADITPTAGVGGFGVVVNWIAFGE